MRGDTYWTTGKGTRHETRCRRCKACGNVERREPGRKFGPCPFTALHERAPGLAKFAAAGALVPGATVDVTIKDGKVTDVRRVEL